jgi:antitoxin (DNA-binding transcriptional repressor) of toxin-antitoxin stability system
LQCFNEAGSTNLIDNVTFQKMRTFSITEVKANFSRLVHEAGAGDAFIIMKAGKPVGIVEPLNAEKQNHNSTPKLEFTPPPRD